MVLLEDALPPQGVYSAINSPYRVPMARYLNRYASEAVDYFLSKMSQSPLSFRFLEIISADYGRPLLEEVARQPQKVAFVFSDFMQLQMRAWQQYQAQQHQLVARNNSNAQMPGEGAGLTQEQISALNAKVRALMNGPQADAYFHVREE